MKTYERKLAEKRAKADARTAKNKWEKLQTADIDDILYRMGYRKDGYLSGYKHTMNFRPGMERFKITIDTYDLICRNGNIKVTVQEF